LMNESYWMTTIRKLSRCACEVGFPASSIGSGVLGPQDVVGVRRCE